MCIAYARFTPSTRSRASGSRPHRHRLRVTCACLLASVEVWRRISDARSVMETVLMWFKPTIKHSQQARQAIFPAADICEPCFRPSIRFLIGPRGNSPKAHRPNSHRHRLPRFLDQAVSESFHDDRCGLDCNMSSSHHWGDRLKRRFQFIFQNMLGAPSYRPEMSWPASSSLWVCGRRKKKKGKGETFLSFKGE